MKTYIVNGVVKRFTMPAGWHYVVLPKGHKALSLPRGRWGMVPIRVEIGDTQWRSSLLPMGKHSKDDLFIALPAKVRKKEGIEEGDEVTISFRTL